MIAWVVKADRETLDDIATLVLGQGRVYVHPAIKEDSPVGWYSDCP